MFDLTTAEKSWANKCGQILQEEKAKPSTMPVLLKRIQDAFGDCNVSDKYVAKCKVELTRCRSYTHVLMWLTNKFCYGAGEGVVKFNKKFA